ncbi:hypothetical protein A6R68_12261, partial [Neotoma lepida]
AESKFYTPPQKVSENGAFQTSKTIEITRHGLWCSILEELWQDTDPTKRDQQNQSPPWSPGAFLNKKAQSTDRECECEETRKTIPLVSDFISTQKGAPKLLTKGLKHNLETNGEDRSNITKQLNDVVTSDQLFTQDSSNANCTIPHEGQNSCKKVRVEMPSANSCLQEAIGMPWEIVPYYIPLKVHHHIHIEMQSGWEVIQQCIPTG